MDPDARDSTHRLRGPSHRELYPAQYSDPLCGLRVRVENTTGADGTPIVGIVERVVPSRFGTLAILAEYGAEQAWLASACRPVDCYTLDGVEVTLSEFLAANPDLDPEDVEAILHLQPGEEIPFGGGAAALFILRREMPGWPGRPRVAEAGHAALFVVRSPTGALSAGPFAHRETAAWNARLQERRWWRCPGTTLWFATDEVSTAWMCHSIAHPPPLDRPDFTSITLATEAAVQRLASDEAWVRTAFRQEHGRGLPAEPTSAGWIFCPVIGWYARGGSGTLEVTPAMIDQDHPLDEEHALPLSTVAGWDSQLQSALAGWVFATFGVVLDDERFEPPAMAGWSFHEYEARRAASRILAGVVGVRVPEREDRALHQMVFAYIPVDLPAEYGEIDAIVVEPAESGAVRTLDVCVGAGMQDERLTVPLDDTLDGDPFS